MERRSKTVDIDIPSYPKGSELIQGEAGRIFLQLENHNHLEVAYLFGLDRYFTSESSMRSAITRAYNLVLADPMKYDVAPEKAGFIQGLVSSRGIVKRNPESIREENELKQMDITGMILSTRDLAAGLVRRKLDYLDKHPKALQEEKLKDLGWILGVLFDKGQIIRGEATEHIAVMSSLPEHMNPDEALKAILQMREEFNTKK
jgi:hypothetical protein